MSSAKDAVASEPRRSRRRSIVREFALNTSTHALPGIARSQSNLNRIFWSVSFLIFTGVMSYFIYQSIAKYFEYQTQTSVSIVIDQWQKFPAVTICNYSPLRYDRLIKPYLAYTNARNLTNTNDTTAFTTMQADGVDDFLAEKVNANESTRDYMFPLEMMLISCSYNGMKCTAADFKSFESAFHGLCYTFNTKSKSADDVRDALSNNDLGKLELRLYAQSHLYVPYVLEGQLTDTI